LRKFSLRRLGGENASSSFEKDISIFSLLNKGFDPSQENDVPETSASSPEEELDDIFQSEIKELFEEDAGRE